MIVDLRATADGRQPQVETTKARGRGRLRLFVGMAPGVGKTYRMLEEGHQARGSGVDIAVGFAEPHGRSGVERRIEGLEVVPPRRVEHRGVVVEDMDTDAVLARSPTVALVDELAHPNVPGSARDKRWQDVELIRGAGIDVVSTMNVLHLASLADAAATITGVPVNDRLPDEVLEGADEIELVDLSPQALRQRIEDGHVYQPDRIRLALDKVYTEANLTALRELALRLVARRVEGQIEDGLAGPLLPLVTERVVVLIDGSAASMRSVRRAAALTAALRAAFVAVVVETPDSDRQSVSQRRDLQETIDDAIELGADLVRVDASDNATGLARIARARRATHVVIPHRNAGRIGRLLGRPLEDQLLERLPDVEVHVVAARSPAERDATARNVTTGGRR